MSTKANQLPPSRLSTVLVWWVLPALGAAVISSCHFLLAAQWTPRELCFWGLVVAMVGALIVGGNKVNQFRNGAGHDEGADAHDADATAESRTAAATREKLQRATDVGMLFFIQVGLPFFMLAMAGFHTAHPEPKPASPPVVAAPAEAATIEDVVARVNVAGTQQVATRVREFAESRPAYFDSTWIVVATALLLILIPLWRKTPLLRVRGRRKRFVINLFALFGLTLIALSALRPHLLPRAVTVPFGSLEWFAQWWSNPSLRLGEAPAEWFSFEVLFSGAALVSILVACLSHALVNLVCAGMGERVKREVRTREQVHEAELASFNGSDKARLGLALSGGGIRAGTVALGVLDLLEQRQQLKRIGYLSSVSGGGWAVGAVMAQLVRRQSGPVVRRAIARFRAARDYLGLADGAQAVVGPLLYTAIGAALLLVALAVAVVSAFSMLLYVDQTRLEVLVPTSEVIQALPTPYLGRVSLFFLYVGERLEHVFAVLGIEPIFIHTPPALPHLSEQLGFARGLLGVGFLLGLGLILASAVAMLLSQLRYDFTLRRRPWMPRLTRGVAHTGLIATLLTMLALGILFSATLAVSVAIALVALAIVARTLDWSVTRATAIGGLVLTAVQFAGKNLQLLGDWFETVDKAWAGLIGQFVKFLLGQAESLGVLARWNYPTQTGLLVIASAFGAAFYIVSFLISLEHIGLGSFWRDRLDQAFWRLKEAPAKGELPLTWASLRTETGGGSDWPMPVINATLNSPATREGPFHFEFTPEHAGGKDVGWMKVSEKGGVESPCTIPDALGISSAALNSQGGATIPSALRGVLSLFPLKLGRWLRAPRTSQDGWQPLALEYVGLEAMGFNSADDPYLFVSDGGHLENLGLLALLRRPVPVMMCIDAAADPDYTFNDLSTFLELARRGDWQVDLDLNDLCPPDKPNQFGLCVPKSQVAVGTLSRERDGKTEKRVLIYAKAALGQGLNASTWAYARREEDFPQQTTADQLFDEEQFEAYLEMGRSLGRALTLKLEEIEKAMKAA